jgi:hypothetical protein
MTDQLINRDENGYPVDGSANWLECIPWTGQEAALPAGYTTMVPGLDVMTLIYRVEIMDAEEEAGYQTIKRSQMKPGMVVIGAQINENTTKKICETYGGDWIRLKSANGGVNYNRVEWREKFGTDGLELLAIRNLRNPMTNKAI